MSTDEPAASIEVSDFQTGRSALWNRNDVKIHVDGVPGKPVIVIRGVFGGLVGAKVFFRDQVEELLVSGYVHLGISGGVLALSPTTNPGEFCVPSSVIREMITAAAGA